MHWRIDAEKKERPVTPGTGQPLSLDSSSTAPNTEESEEYTSVSPDVSVNSSGDIVFPWKHREILTLDIPVHDTERAGLGVSVKGKTTGGGAKGIVDLGCTDSAGGAKALETAPPAGLGRAG